MLDLPEPLRPVTALNWLSKGPMTARCAYDLKPSIVTSLTHIAVYCPGRALVVKPAQRAAGGLRQVATSQCRQLA